MIKQAKIATLAVAMCFATVQASRAENLADTLTSAYNNSGLLDQNRALLRAADEDLAQAVSAILPVIGWSASVTNSSPRAPGVDVLQAALPAAHFVARDSADWEAGLAELDAKIARMMAEAPA